MATVKGSGGLGADRLYDVSWTGIAASGDIGSAITIPAHVRELVVQAVGTFTGSLAIQLQGSNDGVNFYQLKDNTGTAISLTSTTGVGFTNPPKFIQPVATAGSGGASANVLIHGTVVG